MLIGNKTQINYVCNIAPKYEILFPNIKIRGDWNRGFYFLNKNCYDEFNKLYNISHLTEHFIEGNVFMVSKKYIDSIFFNNDVIELFYKNLNTVNSFDSNWVSLYYKLKKNSILDLYKVYKENKLYGNCLESKHLPRVECYELLLSNKSIDNYYLPDANIEHVFERLWLNIAISFNYEYKILDYYEDNSKKMIDFDINIYKLLNHKTEFISSIENIYNLQKEIIQQSKEQKNNTIYSLHKILEYLPLDFNIQKYAVAHNLIEKNKYQIINHYIKNVINNNINLSKNTYFNNIEINKHINKNLVSFAILFPQFHELEVNNEIWGNGFTEWDNLKKNKLISNLHTNLHPHQDINYYKLIDKSHLEKINQYCKDYNINGFMIYHYWFKNKAIMDAPVKKLLEYNILNKDKKWFFSWVNEHWVKKWDTNSEKKENEMIYEQFYSLNDIEDHFKYLNTFFSSENYYKPNNKPWLAIYRPNNIPDEYLNELISLSIRNGYEGLTLINTLNNDTKEGIVTDTINCNINNDLYDFDFEFNPNYISNNFHLQNKIFFDKLNENNLKQEKIFTSELDNKKLNQYLVNEIYKIVIKNNKKDNKKQYIRSIFTGWDNLSRYSKNQSKVTMFILPNSFDFFFVCLKQFILLYKENKKNMKKYHIINALNEWCEQAVLEPSIEFNYSMLLAYKYASQSNLNNLNEKLIDKIINF